MSHKPLPERQRRIVNLLKEKNCGFNELYCNLSTYTSRQTLKKDLNNLLKMGLISVKKGRRGQKDAYTCRETLIKFEERIRHLEMEWAKVFRQLRGLTQILEAGELEHEKVGGLVPYLLFKAVTIGSSAHRAFTLEANLRLLNLNAEKFHDFMNKVITFGEKHPEILGGFEKTSGEILETARQVYEKIENKFELLHETDLCEKIGREPLPKLPDIKEYLKKQKEEKDHA